MSPGRTLLVSDLHLSTRTGADVLQEPAVREALVTALAGADRLVLLGDVVELRHAPVGEALALALPVLAALGEGFGGEVVIVPGNHDHALLAPWADRRRRHGAPPALSLDEPVDFRRGEPLWRVASALGRDRVRVAYPGLRVREDVWATHGHYLDPHGTVPTFERIGAGFTARVAGGIPEPDAGPDDYERVLAPNMAWLHAIAQHARPGRAVSRQQVSASLWRRMWPAAGGRLPLRALALRGGVGATIAGLNAAGLGPLKADLSGAELRRNGPRAMSEALRRLGVDARHVVFGHSHRSGPWPGDDESEWDGPGGARLWNTGSWVHDPHFVTRRPNESPYWPGTAVLVEDRADPRPVRLLPDDLSF